MKRVDRGVLLALAALLGVFLLGPVLMGGMMGWGIAGPGMMGWYAVPGAGWTWGPGTGIGGLILLAVYAAVIFGAVLLAALAVARFTRQTDQSGLDEALSILRRRYAAGDIDQETYERMRSELGAV
jgi:putative membrane protein